jgi:nucleobase transporter 1/2
MVESLGDYFAAADIAGAPVPPPGVISRAIALQGATCALAGVWGTTSGTTAYNEVMIKDSMLLQCGCGT